ncbi:membrane protein insertase YidC [bacterium]|nr:membrane protein insertase YidC [bacterium]
MDLLITAFNEILYRPLFNILVLLYNIIPGNDLGIAIIILTIGIKLVLYPLNQKAIKSQKALQELQPKIKEIQKKYKDKTQQAEELLKLYKKAKINPFSGFLPLLIQIPILIALYKVFLGINDNALNNLYSFISKPENLNPMFLGIINLSEKNWILAGLAGVFQFIQSKMNEPKSGLTDKKTDFSYLLGKQMVYLMPVITVLIAGSLPSALALYWIVITLFGIFQQWRFETKKIS